MIHNQLQDMVYQILTAHNVSNHLPPTRTPTRVPENPPRALEQLTWSAADIAMMSLSPRMVNALEKTLRFLQDEPLDPSHAHALESLITDILVELELSK